MNRFIHPHSFRDMKKMLARVDVSSQGVDNMAPKAFAFPIKLTGVEIGAANIIKQEMLTVGGDAAISRGIVEGIRKESDIILLGTVDKIRKLIRKLSHYTTFGIPQIRADLDKLLHIYSAEFRHKLQLGRKTLQLNQTRLVGILNVTPDSFSDGGENYEPGKAVARGLEMFEQGADIIDIGGESSRPGATPIEVEAELARIIPVITGIREKNSEKLISVDTYKAEVAKKAIANGADIINDISALRFDSDMTEVLLANNEVPVILMHMQGTPRNMQDNPVYEDVVDDILYFFEERIAYCLQAGIAKERIIIDPGIGFGKTFKHNMEIFRRLAEFHSLGVPIMIGASRKQFIEKAYPYPASPKERISGSLAITSLAYQNKIGLVRVHDVKEHFELLTTLQEIYDD